MPNSVNAGLAWVGLSLPAHHYAIAIIQQSLCTQAKNWGFTEFKIQQMELAVEEAINTILQLIHGDELDIHTPSVGHFDVKISVLDHVLQLRITDYDLPYDLSMIPLFSVLEADSDSQNDGLSFFLLRQLVDELRVHHPGINGQTLELEWALATNPAPVVQTNQPQALEEEGFVPSFFALRALQASDAIYLARLMHQNYGYSYVNPDLYIAERIRLRHSDGRLTSMVAVDAEQNLIGHCALMKSDAESDVVELGAAVVSPTKQGLGIFNILWQSLEDQLPFRQEKVACVHAVTCHPFTQKIVLKHGYVMSALLLGYTPTSIQFKSVQNQNTEERGSVYYCAKLLQPVAALRVYLPPTEQNLVLKMAEQLQMPLVPQPIDDEYVDVAETSLQYHIEASLQVAFLSVTAWAEDGGFQLKKQWKYLCRARVDVIYATIDLTQAHAPAVVKRLVDLGFISGGFAPYMPYPATLLLQYINNQQLTQDSVYAVGDMAQYIKSHVFTAYKQQEMISD